MTDKSNSDRVKIDIVTHYGNVLVQFSDPVKQEVSLKPDQAREVAENIIVAAYMAEESNTVEVENYRTLDNY